MRILVVVPDLFFRTRIESTAARLGTSAQYSTLDDAFESCQIEPPDRLILDLHAPGDPLGLVRALRANEGTRSIEIVGFYSHVDQELRTAALESGMNRVMPRSAFTSRLAQMLGETPAT